MSVPAHPCTWLSGRARNIVRFETPKRRVHWCIVVFPPRSISLSLFVDATLLSDRLQREGGARDPTFQQQRVFPTLNITTADSRSAFAHMNHFSLDYDRREDSSKGTGVVECKLSAHSGSAVHPYQYPTPNT